MTDVKATVIDGAGVTGNITDCKIENQTKSVQKNSVFSLTETTTYMTYDVCTRQTISEYTVPTITVFGFLVSMFVGVVLLVIAGGIVAAISDIF